jgi:hypothetical protein
MAAAVELLRSILEGEETLETVLARSPLYESNK